MTRAPRHRAAPASAAFVVAKEEATVPPDESWSATGLAALLAAVATVDLADDPDLTGETLVTAEGAC